MASVNIIWNHDEGFDLHVLAGETSPSLLDLLIIGDDSTPQKWVFAKPPLPADVASVTFTPNFVSAAHPPANGGVSVDTATGKVTVAAAPTLRSFVLEATVKLKPPSSKTLGPIPIRVLVHKTIEDMWLTPSTLTVRDGSPGQRLTVLARFDDNTIGDITRRPGIAWASADSTKIAVAANGALTAKTHPTDPIAITATHAGKVATARVVAKAPWAAPSVVTLVPGSAGLAKAATVPNFLFLAEGFTAADRPKFEALVRGIVQRMQTTGSLRPFDLAKGAMNFWMAFVPSRQRGTSPLYDLNPSPFGAKFFGAETPMTAKPDPPPTPPPIGPPEPPKPYTIENLVYQVGLPTLADAGVPADDARRNWIARYGPDIGPRVSDALYLDWLDLRDHRLANEVDNAFGLGNGNRPVMHERDPAKVADFHPLRTTRAHLDTFLRNLRVGAVTGPAIGAIWATKSPAIPDPAGAGLPAGLQNGQDSTFVFMLCGGTPFCGVQKSGLIVSSLRNETTARLKPVAGTRQLDFDPYDLPVGAPLAIGSRVAHEIAHSFGLKDEYGEFSTLRIPATEEQGLKSQGNVQPASELERSAADRRLDPAKLGKIKWLWPRVDRAGVLAAEPVAAPAGFTLTLARGHGRGFRPGDIVRLRLRPLTDEPAGTSGRLTVTAAEGDLVTVTPRAGTAILTASWPAGSVLIRPVRGVPTPGDRDGADLPLVAPIIAAHLATSFLPLDLAPGPPVPACTVDDRDVQIPANLPAGLPLGRPRYRAQIVGLYDNGARYFCGVYHPTGACLMRTQEPITDPVTGRLFIDPVSGRPTTYLLCPVCRYWLVDRLDPTQHAAIDDDYAKRYPQP